MTRLVEDVTVEGRRLFDARVLRMLGANGNTDPLTAGELAAAMRYEQNQGQEQDGPGSPNT